MATLSADDVRAIARDAYVYGFPLVDNYRIQYSYFVDRQHPEFKAPWNQIHNEARVYTPADKTVQTPNSDTPYSQLGADLRGEPLVLTMPAVERERYYSAQFIDLYTFNFAYVGSRATGNGPGSFLLAGPRWTGERPAEVKKTIRSETEFAFVLYRTQLFGPDDIANVKRIQAGYKVQTLSAFLGKAAPPPAPAIHFPRPLTNDRERTSFTFFDELNFILQFCPTHPSETDLMARFAKLGIGPGLTFLGHVLSPDLQKAIEAGIADAWRADEEVAGGIATHRVEIDDLFGSREHLRNNYVYRMAAAAGGIYGNSSEEAFYYVYYVDAAGQNLDAARHRYTLHFAPGQLPPVSAFWSVTLYELPSQQLSPNPLNRYLINSPMLPALTRDPDGGLTLYVQHDSPGRDREANWLPAPEGPVKVGLRLYGPKAEAQNHTWRVPPLESAAL